MISRWPSLLPLQNSNQFFNPSLSLSLPSPPPSLLNRYLSSR